MLLKSPRSVHPTFLQYKVRPVTGYKLPSFFGRLCLTPFLTIVGPIDSRIIERSIDSTNS